MESVDVFWPVLGALLATKAITAIGRGMVSALFLSGNHLVSVRGSHLIDMADDVKLIREQIDEHTKLLKSIPATILQAKRESL